MDEVFFEELGIPTPEFNLEIGSGSHAVMTAKMLVRIEESLDKIRPRTDVVIVQGDTNSTLAGALVASKKNIKIAHVEAGLRSYDKAMPEEINRLIVDKISDYLFCPTQKQVQILDKEGFDKQKVFLTGNTIVDAIYSCKELSKTKSGILDKLNLKPNKYFLLTCHRPSNTDDDNFREILEGIQKTSQLEDVFTIFPVHPRLRDKIKQIGNFSRIISIDPISFLESIFLQNNSLAIFSDSGGICEEACILQKKCVVLRTNTERPEAVEVGGACILPKILSLEIQKAYFELKNKQVNWYNPLGDGFSYKQILDVLVK
jgi:UDP-N-acetylglucosamine 2-epimerase (non-hydrolysing)